MFPETLGIKIRVTTTKFRYQQVNNYRNIDKITLQRHDHHQHSMKIEKTYYPDTIPVNKEEWLQMNKALQKAE